MSDVLYARYQPVAVELPDSDSLEYVVRDCECYYEHVEGTDMALVRSFDIGSIIGVRISNWSKLKRPSPPVTGKE